MFGWLFGKGKKAPDRGQSPDRLPEEVEAVVRLQRDYWTYRPEEQAALQARGWARLSWPERLRLHHLNCLEMLGRKLTSREPHPGRGATEGAAAPAPEQVQRCRQTASGLLAADSPFRPRRGLVWQGQTDPQGQRPPDLEGTLGNASLTHLGCLEVLRLDEQMRPRALDFVPFDDLSQVAFAPPKLFRAAKLFYETGQDPEVMFVPLLYGLTWELGDEFCRSGRMTRFEAYLGGDGPAAGYGVGLGQQDLALTGKAGQTLFGLGSVAQFGFALEVADPRFDEKCRARGLDPDAVRRQLPGPGS